MLLILFLLGGLIFTGIFLAVAKAATHFIDQWSPADSINVEIVLRQHGMWKLFEEGQLKCVYCRKSVSLENLGMFLEGQGSVILVCKDIHCTVQFFQDEEGHAYGTA